MTKVSELADSWIVWNETDRLAYAKQLARYEGEELPELLRFVMRHGDSISKLEISHKVACFLPEEEAVSLLLDCMSEDYLGPRANFIAALAMTRSDRTVDLLRSHLVKLYNSPDLWKNDDFCNYTALDLIWCLHYLIKLGVPPSDLNAIYLRMLDHPTMADYAIKWLGDQFTISPENEPGAG